MEIGEYKLLSVHSLYSPISCFTNVYKKQKKEKKYDIFRLCGKGLRV